MDSFAGRRKRSAVSLKAAAGCQDSDDCVRDCSAPLRGIDAAEKTVLVVAIVNDANLRTARAAMAEGRAGATTLYKAIVRFSHRDPAVRAPCSLRRMSRGADSDGCAV